MVYKELGIKVVTRKTRGKEGVVGSNSLPSGKMVQIPCWLGKRKVIEH